MDFIMKKPDLSKKHVSGLIRSKPFTEHGRKEYDRIFRKKKGTQKGK